jgi:hypothetical protein
MSKQSDHNEGQKDGSKASGFDEIAENFNPFTSPEYKEGFRHGVEQQSHSNPDKESSSSDSGGSESGGSSSSICFLSTACTAALGLPDDCLELRTLREFRDEYVAVMPRGAAELTAYYELAPRVVRTIDAAQDPVELYGKIYEFIVHPCVQLIEEGLLEAAFKLYKRRTHQLCRALALL